jgi:hypothetical protein
MLAQDVLHISMLYAADFHSPRSFPNVPAKLLGAEPPPECARVDPFSLRGSFWVIAHRKL